MTSQMTAQDWIDQLGLLPHPEGGFYKETYRSELVNEHDRSASTAIYFLLRSQDVSHFHRIDADEVWHFYAGSAITVHVLNADGSYDAHVLGNKDTPNFQAVVPAGAWFGATVDSPNAYALVGCTVAPGFNFSGFEMATKAALINTYSEHEALIERLTMAD